MAIYSPTATNSITPTTTDRDGRSGQIPRQFAFTPAQGVPRFEDLLSLRVLERSPTVSLPMNTIRNQVTTTDWGIRPTVESPSTVHNEAADEIETFLDGEFNRNGQKFSNLLKLFVTDILSPDTGTLECVPTEPDANGNRWLAELYHLDGITMTKELDRHGHIPQPPESAYYQFAPKSALPHTTWDEVMSTIGSKRNRSVLLAYGRRQHKPVEFTRDQVVWLERNPQSATNYGYGKVQQVRHWAEILLNVDLSNSRYFSDNEIPQGILSIATDGQEELDRSRAYFQDTIKGQTDHIIPMFDAKPDDIDWTPIQGTPEELQFLNSQQWYHHLVWYLFGLNQNEIGDSGDVNQSIGQEHSRQVFRQTTKPLLDDIDQTFNGQILPKHEAYWRVDGELEFYFEIEHEQMEALERQRQTEDLQNHLTTPNAIRQERGDEDVPWGDVPPDVITAMSRKHPEWALENWGGVDGDDLPSPGIGDMDLLSGHSGSRSASDTTADESDEERGMGNPKSAGREVREGEIGEEFPGVDALIGGLQDEVSRQIEHELEDLEEAIEEQWPEDDVDGEHVLNVDGMVEDLALSDVLVDPVVEANTAAMQQSADVEADRLEEDLEQEFGLVEEVAEIGIDFDLQDTFAWEAMRRRAARNMVSVEESTKDQVRNVLLDVAGDGGDVNDVTSALNDRVPEISQNQSRLVARTELPQASREGTQALGEATDVIGGKRWLASNDSRSRPWHDAMHEAVVEIDDSWTVPSGWQGSPDYQPSDYPRTAHTVGEDQPFNCRCVQQSVLEEDLPDDARSLGDVRGVTVDVHVTERQFDVWRTTAEPGEGMSALLERIDENNSRNRDAPAALNVGKEAYYQWIKEFGVY